MTKIPHRNKQNKKKKTAEKKNSTMHDNSKESSKLRLKTTQKCKIPKNLHDRALKRFRSEDYMEKNEIPLKIFKKHRTKPTIDILIKAVEIEQSTFA